MAEHLLYTGCDGTEDCRDSYIDLRDDDYVIEDHVLSYINTVLGREDDSTDYEKEGVESLINRLTEGEEERAKRFIAGAVTDYFRGDGQSYID